MESLLNLKSQANDASMSILSTLNILSISEYGNSHESGKMIFSISCFFAKALHADRWTDGWIDGQTPSHRDAKTHLKMDLKG